MAFRSPVTPVERQMDSPLPPHFSYWGKTTQEDEKDRAYHPLPYHALDVAAVGAVLLRSDPLLGERLNVLRIPDSDFERLVCFLLAIHDSGKFSTPAFQNKDPEAEVREEDRRTGNHTDLGYRLWREHLWPKATEEGWLCFNGSINSERGQDAILPLLRAVCGHHGRPPREEETNLREVFLPEDLVAAEAFARDCSALFLEGDSIPFPAERDTSKVMKKASWILSGLCVLADWIGSDDRYFPPLGPTVPPDEYFRKIAIPRAEEAVRAKKAAPAHPAGYRGLNALFPDLFPEKSPTPLQAYVATAPIGPGPHLFIIEDATGSGKTEAAITLAHRLMAQGEGEGIYVALPTMATANAMYERIEKVSDHLFGDRTYSTVLAHSASRLYGLMKAYLDGNGEGTAGTSWLADNRKKALLAQVGVGTIDQALLAVLPVRHQSLRLLGLARNILIVDEVHACDRYMHGLLQRLLEFHGALGGSAILLSATLPGVQRRELAASFARRIPGMETEPQGDGYPLLTHICRAGGGAVPFPQEKNKRVNVTLTAAADEAEEAIVRAARAGKCACWIRNTVDDAVAAWQHLSTILPAGDMHLFHARVALADRLGIEKEVTTLFGKGSSVEDRAGQVLIATQVVEQSLDLDFDLMVSDLAPIDRLIQRAGRLHRHKRGDRGEARLIILSPPLATEPDETWYRSFFPGGAAVYPDHARLWLTARLLHEKGEIVMPRDAHPFVEAISGEKSDAEIPPGFRRIAAEVRGLENADASFGLQNALKFKEGYAETGGLWEDDVRTPTRLGEPTVTLRLARWDGEHLLPWADEADPRIAWDLSQVSVREKEVSGPSEFSGALKNAVERALAGMRDHGRGTIIVPLRYGNGVWRGTGRKKSGKDVVITYDKICGLSVERN